MPAVDFIISRDESAMMVFPDHPDARRFLTLSYREMTKDGTGKTVFRNLRKPMYNVADVRGKPALLCYQGFWQSLKEEMEGKGHRVQVVDRRVNVVGQPNLKLALLGLRDFQKPWILKALMRGDSGLLGAPTRFGKSWGMTSIAKAFSQAKTVVAAPGVDLCAQLLEHFQKVVPERDVRGVFSGSRSRVQSPDITICSMDSLQKMDPDDTDLLLIDEPHAVVSDTRLPKLAEFARARKYGFGATLKGRFDKKDRLIEGLIGPILSNVSYLEAVDCGAISPLKVILLKIPFSKDTVPGNPRRETVLKRLFFQSSRVAKLVKQVVEEVIPNHWQVMAFIDNEAQAEFYLEHAFPDVGTIAMAKRLKKSERDDLTAKIASGEVWRVLASKIYVQGLTFPELKVVINLAGGGANTTAIQKPGRLLQRMAGKSYGVLIDFIFECRDSALEQRRNPPYSGVVGDSWARHAAYKEIGYEIEFVETAARAREIVLGSHEGDVQAVPGAPGS